MGYTHFLGGPYGLAKFFLWFFIIGTLFFSIFVTGLSFFAGRMIGKYTGIFSARKEVPKEGETIKVDAKIID